MTLTIKTEAGEFISFAEVEADDLEAWLIGLEVNGWYHNFRTRWPIKDPFDEETNTVIVR